jgi:hypothetical protein
MALFRIGPKANFLRPQDAKTQRNDARDRA